MTRLHMTLRPRSGRRSARPREAICSIICLVCALWASGAAAQILTLEEIEARAQRDRVELAVPRASIARAQAELAVVEARSGPTFGARAEGAVAPGGALVTVLGENDTPYLVQGSQKLTDPGAWVPRLRFGGVISGKLILLDFGRTKLGAAAARAAIGAERANLIRAKVELVQHAREAYMLWVEAHQTWQLAERDADVAAARTVSVRELIAEGARPATDATLSAYDEQMARLRQSRAARAAESALEALGDIVQSKLPEHSVPDLEVLEVDESESASAAPVATRQDKDATLSALDLSRQAALSAARAAERNGAAPVLDGSMEVGVQGQDTSVFPVYRMSVGLNVPIWDGGAQAAQAAVHRAEAEELDAQRSVRKLTLEREQEAARRRSRAAATGLQLSLDLLKVAEQMLTEAEDHYRSGSDTLERVLGAQRSLVQARREVLMARIETARARLELTPIKVME